MLMTTERWSSDAHPFFNTGPLIARSVTTIIYAAFLISPQMLEENWKHHLNLTRPDEAIKTFLRSTWSLTRVNCAQLENAAPGLEFGATLDEVKLTSDGKNLLTSIGRFCWEPPPYWHPLRQVPGSAWNKFLRNHCQPIFPESPSENSGFRITIAGSLSTLENTFEEYYFELRSRMDQVRMLFAL